MEKIITILLTLPAITLGTIYISNYIEDCKNEKRIKKEIHKKEKEESKQYQEHWDKINKKFKF